MACGSQGYAYSDICSTTSQILLQNLDSALPTEAHLAPVSLPPQLLRPPHLGIGYFSALRFHLDPKPMVQTFWHGQQQVRNTGPHPHQFHDPPLLRGTDTLIGDMQQQFELRIFLPDGRLLSPFDD